MFRVGRERYKCRWYFHDSRGGLSPASRPSLRPGSGSGYSAPVSNRAHWNPKALSGLSNVKCWQGG
jgi:hypothetical protein